MTGLALELHSFWSWVPAADYLSNPEFSLSRQLIRNTLPINDVTFRWGEAVCHQCDLDLEETALHAFYNCPQVQTFWDYVDELTACITPNWLVSINLTYALPPFSGVKRTVFFMLLAVARIVV